MNILLPRAFGRTARTARTAKTITGIVLIALCLQTGIAMAQNQGTGLPLPRYVSVRAAEVNLRTGPGVQYPVEWVFRRRQLPIEIIKEYRTWRLIRDWQGTQGWMHQSMLSGTRTFMVTGKLRTVRVTPDAKSRAVAVMEPGAIGELLSCPASTGWCQVRAETTTGWLRRVEFWGVYRNEAFQ